MNKSLSTEELRRLAPSIFTGHAHQSRSAKYAHVPTIAVIEHLKNAGYAPTFAKQTTARRSSSIYKRHMIRLRRVEDFDTSLHHVGDSVPEIILTNSHDGSTAFRMDAGLYRLVCSNGMVIKSQDFGSIAMRHTGPELFDEIDAAAQHIIDYMPKILAATVAWDKLTLNMKQRQLFAAEAIQLRYPDYVPITALTALTPRRFEDEGDSVWKTFNVLQENLTRGGLGGRSISGKNTRSRAINAIPAVLSFNRGLWQLAENFAKIAA